MKAHQMTGEDMKAIRKELGLTQSQMAAVLGYGHAMRISEFERTQNRADIPYHTAMIMQALAYGWRPENWQDLTTKETNT